MGEHCFYPSTSWAEWKGEEAGKEFSLVAEKESHRAKKKAPENSFPTFFFFSALEYAAHVWHKANDCLHRY